MTEKEKAEYLARLESRYRTYEGFGEHHTLAEWVKLLNLPKSTMCRYLKAELTIEDICRMRQIEYRPSASE
jgi:Fic family protein